MTTVPSYASVADCEAAFYAAFAAADLEAMMVVWASDAPLLCIHPGAAPLTSRIEIEQSWSEIFRGTRGVQFTLSDAVTMDSQTVSVRYVHENIHHGPGLRSTAVVCATNVYVRERSSWRMSLHHASPGPPSAHANESGVH